MNAKDSLESHFFIFDTKFFANMSFPDVFYLYKGTAGTDVFYLYKGTVGIIFLLVSKVST